MTNDNVSAKKLAAFLAENQPARNEELQFAVLQRVHLGFFVPANHVAAADSHSTAKKPAKKK